MNTSDLRDDACESVEPYTRYEKSSNHVTIDDATRASLSTNKTRLLPGVNDLLHEVRQLKEQLFAVKEERDEFKEEVSFLKYQLAYRVQVENLQKKMNAKKQTETRGERRAVKKHKSVRFSSNVSVENGEEAEEGEEDESVDEDDDPLSSSANREEYSQLKAEKEELEEVLYDFYHDAKMAGEKERILVGNIDSHPSESVSSLICRVLVNYEKLDEEQRILAEEKSKLNEDKLQLSNSMAKLREQLHDAVDANIEEIEDLNRENEELRFRVKTLEEKDTGVRESFVQSLEQTVGRLKSMLEQAKGSSADKVVERLKFDISQAENELKETKEKFPNSEEEFGNKLKRVQSLPSSFKHAAAPETTERGGLLRELKTCKDLQGSQRVQIQRILEEKLDLETQVSDLKRQLVLLRAERRANIKVKSRLVQTEGIVKENGVVSADVPDRKDTSDKLESLSRKCKDLEMKLEEARREKSTVEDEKTCLLMSLDANIEKKDALQKELNELQAKVVDDKLKKAEVKSVLSTKTVFTQTFARGFEKQENSLSETDGGFQASYKKDISQVKVGIERIRIQEQDKQITFLKRENEVVKEKLKKAEDMSQTLQNCLKEITDEKHELLDSIEELNEEKAELEEARMKLEKELYGEKSEKFVTDEVRDIRKKERKVGSDIEASKAKLTQLDLKVLEVLSVIANGEAEKKEGKINPEEDVEDMIGSLLSTVDNLKRTVSAFKTTYDKTKDDSLRIKAELEETSQQKNELQTRVDSLEKKIEKMTTSLENNSKSQTSYESDIGRIKKECSRLQKELAKMRDTKTAAEKSLRDIRNRKAELQGRFDNLKQEYNETTSFLAQTTKELEHVRSTNDTLTKEIESLREDLDGTVQDRDELLELLDRIVCENGTAEGKQGLGLKVERIRERNRSEEVMAGENATGDSEKAKPIEEKVLVSKEVTVESSSPEDAGVMQTERNEKSMNELVDENRQLKNMIKKMIDGQKKMEMALSSFSEVNTEIQRNLEESIEHTEQIRVRGSEKDRGHDVVDYAADYLTKVDENVELRELQEVMRRTIEALSVDLRRLEDEKTRLEQMKNSWQEMSQKNVTLESKIKSLTDDKAKLERELSALENKRRKLEKKADEIRNEKVDLKNLLAESKDRVNDLKLQIESVTEINQDLSESNEQLSKTSKETESTSSRLKNALDESEFKCKSLEKENKRLHQQLAEKDRKKTGIELELEQSKQLVASLTEEVGRYSEKSRKLQSNVDDGEKELKILRDTASKVLNLQKKADNVGVLESEMVTARKTLVQREKQIQELEKDVTRLKKEIENSQVLVRDVSQQNDTLRDSLSEWEREASRIRQHVHQVSQDAERSLSVKEQAPQEVTEETVKSLKAFEAMQVEMDSINKHLISLTNENKKLSSKVKKLSSESNEIKDRNIQLLTRYDMLSKDMEKKVLEIEKLEKDLKNVGAHARTNIESRDKVDRQNSVLRKNCERLERDNAVLKNSLANTLDEERILGKRLRSLVEALSFEINEEDCEDLARMPKDIGNNEWDIESEVSGLATEKPDLIRHSKAAKDDLLGTEQQKYKDEQLVVESSGAGKDVQELVKGVLKEHASLKNTFQGISQVLKNNEIKSTKLEKELETIRKAKEKMYVSLKATRKELDEMKQANSELEDGSKTRHDDLEKVRQEKSRLENEAALIKEKCDKLQAVFRALILVMNDKKGKIDGDKKGGRHSDEAEGPSRLIDYIKGIKTKYTTLVEDKEKLEETVKSLEREIEEFKTKEKLREKNVRDAGSERGRDDVGHTKAVLEEKEKILNELLLASAREKRMFVEKLQEVYDEFDRVKAKLGGELRRQREASPGTVGTLEKVYQEFVESVSHTETFVQSVVHERRVTLVADASSEKDPNIELAKENEELMGKINVLRASRRRETQNLKEELGKLTKEKEDALRDLETKLKSEIESVKKEYEKKLKDQEQVVSNVQHSWKEEVDQLKYETRRMTEEHQKAQQALRSESRMAVEKAESKNKVMKAEVDKIAAEKKENDSKMAEMKRKFVAEEKEKARLAESEVSHVRANWADAERKLRTVTEEKLEATRQLEKVTQEKREQESKTAREMQKLRLTLESVQKQMDEKEGVTKKERERLQRTIDVLEGEMRRDEVSGLKRTHSKITEFQQALEELAKKNKQLESAKNNSERNLGGELEKLRYENSRLERELRDVHEPPRTGVNIREQPRRVVETNAPPAERVKVFGVVKQAPIDKPRMISPLESMPGPIPGPAEAQQRVKVREGQAEVILKGQVLQQGGQRTSDSRENRDPVFEELGAIFQQLNDAPEWGDIGRDQASVIHARPVQTRTQGSHHDVVPSQKPQPEWERARPHPEDPRRNAPATGRRQEATIFTASGRPLQSSIPQRIGPSKEAELYNPPSYSRSKQMTKQDQDLQGTRIKKRSTDSTERHQVEARTVPVERKPRNGKSRQTRRPSIGSDDVFLSNSQEVIPSLLSHGAKNSDFWKSRSLTDLTDISDDKTVERSGHHTARKHKQKLPKSFSGPRKGEGSKRDIPQGGSSLAGSQQGRNNKDTKAKKIAALKGMEYVIFQHQI